MTMHKIPAHEVVPGMLIGVGFQWEPCTWVGSVNGDRDWIGFQVKGGVAWGVAERKDEMIVRLPGPSPRQLLCTCAYASADGAWYRPLCQHAAHCLASPNLDKAAVRCMAAYSCGPPERSGADHAGDGTWTISAAVSIGYSGCYRASGTTNRLRVGSWRGR